MFKRLTALIMGLVFLTIASAALAEDVYITKQGSKYHKEDCRFIKNRDTEKIDIEDAKAKGLEPCGRCFGSTESLTENQTDSEKVEGMVYITENGKKYHKPDCRLIKNRDTTGITVAEAEAKGLSPCGKCFLQKQAKAE